MGWDGMGWEAKRGVHVIATDEHRIGTFFIPFSLLKRINCEENLCCERSFVCLIVFPSQCSTSQPSNNPSFLVSSIHFFFGSLVVVQLHQMGKTNGNHTIQ